MSKKSKPKSSVQVVTPTLSKVSIFEKYHLPIVLLITLGCFINTLGHEFVEWDDNVNIYENVFVSTFSFDNFFSNTFEIFKQNVHGNYNPLSIFSLAIAI